MVRTAGFLLLFALLQQQPARAADAIEGKVVGILTGDTLVVLETIPPPPEPAENGNGKRKKKKRRPKPQTRKHTILLTAIDAPVNGQPYFFSSQASLKKLAYKRKVHVEWDSYDERCTASGTPKAECKKVGRVTVDGKDIGLEQVKLGMAWVNPDEIDELSTPDRTIYGEAMTSANRKRIGLWHARKPVAPWDFYKTH